MKYFAIVLFVFIGLNSVAQKYITRNGEVRFFSETPVENIEAVNNQGACILDMEKGEVVSKILMKSFRFEKALMEEHFNENYVESDIYPQASLNATILNINEIDMQKSGKQEITLEGELSIHGVTKDVSVKGNISIKDNIIFATSSFIVKPADYNIEIPKIVRDNIAKEIEVTVNFQLKPLNP
ncbi:MAG: YceI family protein [Prolixibacteraceae bacterium]|nr:YceI family protein [Prolixibacteraceae bacterium]